MIALWNSDEHDTPYIVCFAVLNFLTNIISLICALVVNIFALEMR